MVQTGWTQEDPTDTVDEFAVGCAWWCRGVVGGGAAASECGATVSLNFKIECFTFPVQNHLTRTCCSLQDICWVPCIMNTLVTIAIGVIVIKRTFFISNTR